ncbi:13484_t:CDS:2 [Gigaspora margarita]|uniref:13484_t:CDS:1 n=1 Tax=Gigaspora margarita TaxID=4874 RepID=A0ABM8W2P8_GIGMA|nr:13484_t:CDS:2 [Gigaspora margarita]
MNDLQARLAQNCKERKEAKSFVLALISEYGSVFDFIISFDVIASWNVIDGA